MYICGSCNFISFCMPCEDHIYHVVLFLNCLIRSLISLENVKTCGSRIVLRGIITNTVYIKRLYGYPSQIKVINRRTDAATQLSKLVSAIRADDVIPFDLLCDFDVSPAAVSRDSDTRCVIL